MPESSDNGGLKRKRVSKACQKCRLLKAKCDGKTPTCGRCEGYGYKCIYRESARGSHPDKSPRPIEDEPSALYRAITGYENLVRDIVPRLSESDRAKVEETLGALRADISGVLYKPESLSTPGSPTNSRSFQARARLHGYHGEVSDVQFFNVVKRTFQEINAADEVDQTVDNYEQDDIDAGNALVDLSFNFPDRTIVEEHLGLYFSTIHVAYPFIPRSSFVQTYHKLSDGSSNEKIKTSWLATFYVILAIGSYYTSFTNPSSTKTHEKYFQRAIDLTSKPVWERSVEYISFLLTKCFYLLAVSKTDSCWITLGIAIRAAQSIGLHVHDETFVQLEQPQAKLETIRRVWYSLYVLDRLLALQLGRPPAIHDEDCHVQLPSRVDDENIGVSEENQGTPDEKPLVIDYFLCVIEFSKIVGCVLRELYNPQKKLSAGDLAMTKELDERLRQWKTKVPRLLRFDLGHPFERSALFKRQRTMLATKFHHLRALIHRPYLSAYIQEYTRQPSLEPYRGDQLTLSKYQRTCVLEAQEIAHLLHNVTDKESLIQDFPWWQMISCLICASSILLVAGALDMQSGADEDLNADALQEDAETCLKVFEALSSNSNAARMARDMLGRLKWREKSREPSTQLQTQPASHLSLPDLQLPIFSAPTTTSTDPPFNLSLSPDLLMHPQPYLDDTLDSLFGRQEWPSEILDPLVWSAQFFDAGGSGGASTSSSRP